MAKLVQYRIARKTLEEDIFFPEDPDFELVEIRMLKGIDKMFMVIKTKGLLDSVDRLPDLIEEAGYEVQDIVVLSPDGDDEEDDCFFVEVVKS